jgi:Mn2+/Fe2+ NRAMP family transporter
MTSEESTEAQRKQRFRRTIVLLLLLIVLLLLAFVVLAVATPDWQPDGSRPDYSAAARAVICASLVAGTVLIPVSLRELILGLIPSKTLGLILAIGVAITGAIAAPIEIWLTLIVTDSLGPGSQQRYESDDTDWDWD